MAERLGERGVRQWKVRARVELEERVEEEDQISLKLVVLKVQKLMKL